MGSDDMAGLNFSALSIRNVASTGAPLSQDELNKEKSNATLVKAEARVALAAFRAVYGPTLEEIQTVIIPLLATKGEQAIVEFVQREQQAIEGEIERLTQLEKDAAGRLVNAQRDLAELAAGRNVRQKVSEKESRSMQPLKDALKGLHVRNNLLRAQVERGAKLLVEAREKGLPAVIVSFIESRLRHNQIALSTIETECLRQMMRSWMEKRALRALRPAAPPPPAAAPPAAAPPAAAPPAAAPPAPAYQWHILLPVPQGGNVGDKYMLTIMNAAGQQSQVQLKVPPNRTEGGDMALQITLDGTMIPHGLYVARIYPASQSPPPLGRVEFRRWDPSLASPYADYRYNFGKGDAAITDPTVARDIVAPPTAKRIETTRRQDPTAVELVPVRRHTRLWRGVDYDPNLPGNKYNREWLQSPAWERVTYANARRTRSESDISDWYARYLDQVYRNAYLSTYPPFATPGTFVTVKVDSTANSPFSVTVRMPPEAKAGDRFFLVPTTIEVPDAALGARWFLENDLHGVTQPVLVPGYARPGDFVHSYVPRTLAEARETLNAAYGQGHAVKFLMANDPKRLEFARAHAARAAARQAAAAARAPAPAPAPAPAQQQQRAIDAEDTDEDARLLLAVAGGATRSLPTPPSVTVEALNNFIERGNTSNAIVDSDDESEGSNNTRAYGASSDDEEVLDEGYLGAH